MLPCLCVRMPIYGLGRVLLGGLCERQGMKIDIGVIASFVRLVRL
jgi:hypothetical protein